MKVTLKLKPSLLGQYYEMECDRYLVYNSVTDPKELGWTPPKKNSKSAAAEAGKEWEKILLSGLNSDASCEVIDLKKKKGNTSPTFEDTVCTLKSLANKDKAIYIYQANFKVTPSFVDEYISAVKECDSDVEFSNKMLPDFIKAEYIREKEKYRLTIIDAKNAGFLKVGAQIQIALYVKILEKILEDEKIDNCYVNKDEGIVWNREKITNNRLEHVFELKDALAELENFFSKKQVDLCKIADSCGDGDALHRSLNYRISQKCEYCDNFEACKASCKKIQSVRLLPYITMEAQNRLDNLIDSGNLKDDTVASVMTALKNNPEILTEGCSYWNTVKNNSDAYFNGLLYYYCGDAERFPKENVTTHSFPVKQNFSLFFTAQQDVNSGRVYAYAWLLKPGKNIDIWDLGLKDNGYVEIQETKNTAPGKGKYYDSVVAQDATEAEFNRIDREFVERIYELLEKISNYSDEEKRKMQCYVMDHYERINIESALYNMLEYLDPDNDTQLIEKVMAILLWIQGERLVTDSDSHPENIIETPVSVVTTEISKLYVLTEGVAYNLKTVASIFSPRFNFDKDKYSYFGILSNVVEGMHILHAWNEDDQKKKDLKLKMYGYHLRKRLFVESGIVSAVQNDADQHKIKLTVWPPMFSILKPKYPNEPEISKLDFENRYEQLLAYRQIRSERVSGIQNAIDKGSILQLEYTGQGDTYRIINNKNYIGREWFEAWLCEDTPDNRMEIMLLKDSNYTSGVKHYSMTYFKSHNTVFYPIDFAMDYNFTDDGSIATVDFIPKKNNNNDPSKSEYKFSPVLGKKYLLFEVYADANSVKTEKGIGMLLKRKELLDPRKLSGDTDMTYDTEAEMICDKYWWYPDSNTTFSASQKKAFVHLMERKVNVLVGPPASGKTDFIARALITMACYYKEKYNKSLKIQVTAMSHSAIDNVLLKLDKMLAINNPFGIKLYKAHKYDDDKAFEGGNVKLLKKRKKGKKGEVLESLEKDEIQIIGMTCWAAESEFDSPYKFDVIVMDEASQVRAIDAFLCLECSDKNTRFLLVGDDNQLPPIIGGKYKEKEGEKYIHGSIFHMYLTGLGKGHNDIVRLQDNYRMNGILCKYPALKLYGPEYKASKKTIETQQITLMKEPDNEIIKELLDEEYPLVFCELSGLQSEQSNAEKELVTDVLKELWDNLTNSETNNLASQDGNFWRETATTGGKLEGAVGIISPHHEHINRLKTSVSQALGVSRDDVYIGTVDRLQGKERKAIIVSYGVSEGEKIINESEFIFSRNRFNVSMTRGKAKTIIFLSDVIAESNLATNVLAENGDNALKEGIKFIHGFTDYMREEEQSEKMEHCEFDYKNVKLKIWKKRLV